ncbi:hypothetical protein [Salinispora arenicola]|uniref:hypothetical protein n=1 Tax=Salinispora arenicola TaxID=168697 RepID=UPI00039A610B|nr:hypothetical protein [Salinispora arenicola]
MRHGSGDAAGPRRLGEARRIGTGGTGGVSDTHLFGIGSDVPFDYSVSVGCCSTTPCGAG